MQDSSEGRSEWVTSVISHSVRSENIDAYERWLARIVPAASAFPGHFGVDVLRPQSNGSEYAIVLRFATPADAHVWFSSETRKALMTEVEPLLAKPETVKAISGLEFWFTPSPIMGPPRRYKQFLLTLSAIYPLTFLVPWAMEPLLSVAPILQWPMFRHFVGSVGLVAMMVYVVMPRYTRWAATWLHA